MSVHNFSFGNFTWFVGVVENRDDPLKVGRLQVRAFGYHSDSSSIPSSSLPWAQVLQPVTSAAQAGIGQTPTGIQVGTHVIGFFADGDKAQIPIILGTFAGLQGDKNDVDNLGTGENLDETVIAKKNNNLLTSTATTNSSSGLSMAESLAAQVTDKLDSSLSSASTISNSFKNLNIDTLTTKLNSNVAAVKDMQDGITTTTDAVTFATEDADKYLSTLESIKLQVDTYWDIISNMDTYATDYAKEIVQSTVRGVDGWTSGQLNEVLGSIQQIKKLKNLDASSISSARSSLGTIKTSMQAIKNIKNSIASVSNIANVVSNVKNMATGTPAFASIKSIGNAIASANAWVEKKTDAAPNYPLNKVFKSENGHIQEFDDTEGNERYHRYHPSGSYIEVQSDGTQVQKIVKDNYDITMGDKFVHIQGTVKVNIGGNVTLVIDGDCTTQVTGNRTDVVMGDYTLSVGGDTSIVSAGALKESSGSNVTIKGKRIDLN